MILITGATGLTGRYILPILAEKHPDMKIRAIVRSKEDGESLFPYIYDYIIGDLSDDETVKKAICREVKILIHIAGIRFSPKIFEEIKKYTNTIQQMILVHTTGMYSRYREYSQLYRQIEEELIPEAKRLEIPYTIVRPTMIYGSLRDKNMNKLIHYLATRKVFPLFGKSGKMQPIFYKDLGAAILSSVANERAYYKEYNLSGGSVHEYGEIIQIVKEILGSKIVIIPIPYRMALLSGWVYEQTSSSPKLSLEQIRRLSEDKVFDHSPAQKDLGFNPITFKEGIKFEIDEYASLRNKPYNG